MSKFNGLSKSELLEFVRWCNERNSLATYTSYTIWNRNKETWYEKEERLKREEGSYFEGVHIPPTNPYQQQFDFATEATKSWPQWMKEDAKQRFGKSGE